TSHCRDEEPGPDQADGLGSVRGAAGVVLQRGAIGQDQRKARCPDGIISADPGRRLCRSDGFLVRRHDQRLRRVGAAQCRWRRAPPGQRPTTPARARHHGVLSMSQADALDIVQSALWTVIVACSPAVAAAMAVGIVIALLQALTQVQEITLTFIPKIIAILLVASLTA